MIKYVNIFKLGDKRKWKCQQIIQKYIKKLKNESCKEWGIVKNIDLFRENESERSEKNKIWIEKVLVG